MAYIMLALGLVFVIEGLVWALAPGMIEDMLRMLRDMPEEARRLAGLAAMALGLALIWAARMAGV